MGRYLLNHKFYLFVWNSIFFVRKMTFNFDKGILVFKEIDFKSKPLFKMSCIKKDLFGLSGSILSLKALKEFSFNLL